MADRSPAAGALRQAWEVGFNIVAAAVNAVLPPRVRKIAADSPAIGLTLKESRARFLDALADIPSEALTAWPGLRRAKRNANSLYLWTAGLVNDISDVDESTLQIRETAMLGCVATWREDKDLVHKAEFLRTHRTHWKPAEWKKWIVEPIEQHAAEWRKLFDDLAIKQGTPPASKNDGIPNWNSATGVLSIDGKVAKRVANLGSAKNVVATLNRFQNNNWPPTITSLLEPKNRRVTETIASLNDGLKFIRFRAIGTKTDIAWERAPTKLRRSKRANAK